MTLPKPTRYNFDLGDLDTLLSQDDNPNHVLLVASYTPTVFAEQRDRVWRWTLPAPVLLAGEAVIATLKSSFDAGTEWHRWYTHGTEENLSAWAGPPPPITGGDHVGWVAEVWVYKAIPGVVGAVDSNTVYLLSVPHAVHVNYTLNPRAVSKVVVAR